MVGEWGWITKGFFQEGECRRPAGKKKLGKKKGLV
jgi:hypothetical protein